MYDRVENMGSSLRRKHHVGHHKPDRIRSRTFSESHRSSHSLAVIWLSSCIARLSHLFILIRQSRSCLRTSRRWIHQSHVSIDTSSSVRMIRKGVIYLLVVDCSLTILEGQGAGSIFVVRLNRSIIIPGPSNVRHSHRINNKPRTWQTINCLTLLLLQHVSQVSWV